MNEIINNILTRRSVREFIEKPIKREELNEILKAASYAPSGMNRQTWQFTAVTNREKIQKLAKAIAKKLSRENYNLYNPEVIIIHSNERESIWGKEDNACALENIFLAAHSLGIGSVWINQLQDICDEKEIRDILKDFGIPDNHIVYGFAALGYPKEGIKKEPLKTGIIKIVE